MLEPIRPRRSQCYGVPGFEPVVGLTFINKNFVQLSFPTMSLFVPETTRDIPLAYLKGT